MDTQTIDTIALIRQIRDNHYQYLRGKTHAERIAFYREQAEKMQKQIIFVGTRNNSASRTSSKFGGESLMCFCQYAQHRLQRMRLGAGC